MQTICKPADTQRCYTALYSLNSYTLLCIVYMFKSRAQKEEQRLHELLNIAVVILATRVPMVHRVLTVGTKKRVACNHQDKDGVPASR